MRLELWREITIAICLVFIIEGAFPFLYPSRWRQLVSKLAHVDDHTMRMTGLASMLLGLVFLYMIN